MTGTDPFADVERSAAARDALVQGGRSGLEQLDAARLPVRHDGCGGVWSLDRTSLAGFGHLGFATCTRCGEERRVEYGADGHPQDRGPSC